MDSHVLLVPQRTYTPRSLSPSNPSSGQPILGSRPLSDIREITEPNLIDTHSRRKASGVHLGNSAAPINLGPPIASESEHSQTRTIPRPEVQADFHLRERPAKPEASQAAAAKTPQRPPSRRSRWSPDRTHEDDTTKSSLYSINLRNVPPRSSSRHRHKPSHSLPRAVAVATEHEDLRAYMPNQRGSNSPLKEVAEATFAGTHTKQRVPSTTIIKVDSPTLNDILAFPTYHHPRVQIDVQMAAALFVGGSTVEGVVRIVIDEASRTRNRKTLTLERLSIDLLGVEEVFGTKKHIFLSLANELVDHQHPPPSVMIESQQIPAIQPISWLLVPSVSKLPFLLTLPLEVGPPSFKSKNAQIKYLLSATLTLKDAGRQLCVRSTHETSILSVYDPERALVSLPSPLTSSDEILMSQGRERIKVTAGLHRQVWVNGTSLFADVHIMNNSRKKINKVELQLEQIILFYRHAAASTLEMSASQARLFDETERSTICKSVIKQRTQGWAGVPPFSADLRTCSLDLPRGYATIKCNKYFEVRYLLNIVIPLGNYFYSSKALKIQLPIILIHMSSLDVPTNSVAQVAAAIQEKRHPISTLRKQKHQTNSNTHSSSSNSAPIETAAAAAARGSPQRRVTRKGSHNLQGRAFAAPRAASLERQRAQQENLKAIGRTLDASPRKHRAHKATGQARGQNISNTPASPSATALAQYTYQTPPNHRQGQIITDEDADHMHQRFGKTTLAAQKGNVTAPEPLKLEKRDPPRSASAMGYYIPSEDTSRDRENQRPSFDSVRLPTRHSAEGNRPKLHDRRQLPDGTVGGVHLMGVPDAPFKKRAAKEANVMTGKPQWVPERDKWRPHWL